MLDAILYLTMTGAVAFPDTCAAATDFTVEGPEYILKSPRGKPVTVSRRSKDPVNIPVSSGRFRPHFNTENNNYETNVMCMYWCGRLVVIFSSSEGNARVSLEGPRPGDMRIYRCEARNSIGLRIGDRKGKYTLTMRTTFGNEYIFTFDLTD